MPSGGNNFSLHTQTRKKAPRLPFLAIKEHVLGKRFILSLVIIGDARSRTLNRRYRNKDRPANVLAFPIAENEGEIFLNLRRAAIDAPRFNEKPRTFVAHLFIHAMLHLKGYQHGGTMEQAEQKIMRTFDV